MMNSSFLIEKSAEVATRVLSYEDPLQELYMRLFSRPVTPEERREARAFLKDAGAEPGSWALLCHTLLISNEFLFLR